MSTEEYDFTNIENLNVFVENQLSRGTWSVFAALGMRLTFVYENGLILNICGDGRIMAFDVPSTKSLGSDWTKSEHNGVYLYSGEDELSNIEPVLIEMLSLNGVPALKLPWDDFYESAFDDFDEDADEDDLEVDELVLLEAKKIVDGEISDPLWSSVEMTYGDNYLPNDCDFFRFHEMANQLEEDGWIVIWNECCGSCAGSSIRDQREDPERANSPAFVIYGQNADVYFAPDGSIHDYLHYPDELGKGYEMELAKKYGFKVTDQGDGFFLFN
jgi:hypothetical protein